MGFLTAPQAALAAGESLLFATLVFFDFSGAPTRVWDGDGSIVVDSDTYSGLGELGSISEIMFGLNDAAERVTFMVSGVDDDFIALAVQEASVIRNRPVWVWGQYLGSDLQPTGGKILVFKGKLWRMIPGGRGATERTLAVEAWSWSVGRNKSPNAYWSHADQQARFAGDLGLEYVITLKNKQVKWPSGGHFDT